MRIAILGKYSANPSPDSKEDLSLEVTPTGIALGPAIVAGSGDEATWSARDFGVQRLDVGGGRESPDRADYAG